MLNSYLRLLRICTKNNQVHQNGTSFKRRGERGHSGLGVVRTNKLEYEDLLQKFQFFYEMCIRVYRIMGRKSRIVPQLGIEILKKKRILTPSTIIFPLTLFRFAT